EDPEFREEIKKKVLDDCASGDPARMRWTMVPITRKGEETTFVSAMNTPIPGKPLMISTVWDVTEHKRAEEEQRKLDRKVQHAQRLESLGMLAGGIAHDFNNILMAVLGHAELAMVKLPPMSPARNALAEIITAARNAADLCRQMLTYSGRTSSALEKIDLRELVEEMSHLLKTAISKKALLNLNLDRDLIPIRGDPSQIRQILMNLIINASEAIGDRSGVITVAAGATRCDRDYLESTELGDAIPPGLYMHLEVADTGCGMDARTKARVFEPFFSTKFTGRGLGLAAVLGIVRAHKGALKVYSEPGKGTTFKILFPALTKEQEVARPPESSSLANWRGKGTILLVDDEESLIALGGRMLEHLGFDVLTASDGREAVDLYRKRAGEIDLVLLDLTMPHMDGGEAFGELRRINPDVRVILSSGYSRDDVAGRFAGKNLAGVLQKPYTLAKLTESLSAVIPDAEA
ncbi:MAG TPA: hybrid sensor histidine kinase/response regulator, partial [Deltaproteobacteria bacterium]|nr:hybrid sensor histidine kinase/response regulator [Deltaproteobacteria bacterium]